MLSLDPNAPPPIPKPSSWNADEQAVHDRYAEMARKKRIAREGLLGEAFREIKERHRAGEDGAVDPQSFRRQASRMIMREAQELLPHALVKLADALHDPDMSAGQLKAIETIFHWAAASPSEYMRNPILAAEIKAAPTVTDKITVVNDLFARGEITIIEHTTLLASLEKLASLLRAGVDEAAENERLKQLSGQS